MENIIGKTHQLLKRSNQTLAVAESCTGGLLSSYLTQLSGSSKYFLLGIISYSNQAKIKILKVPSRLLRQKGAVSAEVAIKIAEGVKKLAKTDLSIGISGIAGPSGGTPEKPVGTVFIALIFRKKICKKFFFTGTRTSIRRKAALKALQLLGKTLKS
jgi:nicotinamide-nucleotide amidase